MIGGLQRFVQALRDRGLAVSPAEWIETLRALDHTGLEDRERFRQALRCTLVKRAHQRAIFDEEFRRFFARLARGGRGRERTDRGGAGSGGRGRSKGGLAGSPRRETSGRRESPAGAPRDPRPVHSQLDPRRLQRRLREARAGDAERRGRLRRVVVEDRESEPAMGRRRPGGLADPLRRDLSGRLARSDERELAAAVPRLVERIRLRQGRRLYSAPRGRLYLRRVFRDNLAQQGVPFVLPRRQVRPRRSRVVVLADVSWSTARASGLLLSIAGELLLRSRDTRVLLFVDRAVDATTRLDEWLRRRAQDRPSGTAGSGDRAAPGSGILRGGVSFAAMLRALPGLDLEAPSDYGRVFHSLLRGELRPGGRNTVLLILGDGRTNRFDPQDWSFEELAGRCGAVLWLVPEPLERWGSGDSALGAYLPHVDVAVEARDLAGLARGVAELLRRL